MTTQTVTKFISIYYSQEQGFYLGKEYDTWEGAFNEAVETKQLSRHVKTVELKVTGGYDDNN